ncbi:M48 family metallopeptidase [Spirulina sp. CS-785/01]|uniref:M48 family metallopeptidase n=1 Tax=Spirulina sp. CS-785/01 TaxID=3021716 RepID=UPI002330AFF4|nr:M48 family metallopeptidase [Spirulina sp. CS-785/01]MDB9312354.1 M48 family metallopeptidase [Spirulina sp. CS-785/01]
MLEQLSHVFWRSKKRWLYGLLGVVTAFGLWAGTPQAAKAVSWLELLMRGAQILQLSTMSDRQEVALGNQINQQLTTQLARRGTPILDDERLTSYVDGIGQKLAAQSERPEIPYKFQIVADKGINAFATMGGFVYVNAGLMALAENEAELASVVSHEIGHIVGRHAVNQMKDRAIAAGVMSAAGLDQNAAVQIGVQLALNLPNSREDELEADQSGLDNLRDANYNPTAMVSFMQKLAQQSRGSVPTILSTHPATSDRITILRQALAENPPQPEENQGTNPQAYTNNIAPLDRLR